METIRDYLNNMFSKYPSTPEILRAKSELGQMMEDKYNELIAEGKNKNEAIGTVISEFGDVDELIADIGGTSKSQEESTAADANKPAGVILSSVGNASFAGNDQSQTTGNYAQESPTYGNMQGEAQYQGQPPYGNMQYSGQQAYGDAQYQGQQAYGDAQYQGQQPYGDAQYQGQQPYGDSQYQGQQSYGAQYQAQPQMQYSQAQYAQNQYAQPQYQEPPYGDDMFEDEYQYGAFGQYGMGYDGGYQAPVQYTGPTMTYEEAATCAKLGKRRGFLKALGVFLCITCVIWPVLGDSVPRYLGGALLEGLGALGMLGSITIGVLSFIAAGKKTKQIDEIRRGKHTPDPTTMSMIQNDWLQISNGVSTEKTVGILSCCTCFFPTILTSGFRSEFMGDLGAALMFGMVGLGVGLIVHSNAQKNAYRSLMVPMERGAYYNPNMKAKDGVTSGLAAGASVMASTAGEIIRTAKAKSSTNTYVTDAFSEIDINLSRGNVDLKVGDRYMVEISGPVEAPPVWGIENGKLSIRNPENSGFYKHKKIGVVITVPAGVTLSQFVTHVKLGNVSMKEVVVEQSQVHSDMGNIDAEGVSAGILRANSSMGNVTVKRTGAAQGYLSSSMGNVKYDGVFQHLEANTSMGNVDVSTQTELSGLVPENEAVLATSMGVVTVNGKKYGKSVRLPA